MTVEYLDPWGIFRGTKAQRDMQEVVSGVSRIGLKLPGSWQLLQTSPIKLILLPLNDR